MSSPVRLEDLGCEPDGRRCSPSAARNRAEILPVLRQLLPPVATVLEIGSGTGEHAVYFAAAEPGWCWQPTERDPEGRVSIAAWRRHADLPNLLPALDLDVLRPEQWPAGRCDAVVAINVLHIAPWTVTEALLVGAARVLKRDGVLFVYGPFFTHDAEPTAGNVAFDADLRERDAMWGVRHVEDVVARAAWAGLVAAGTRTMPHANTSLLLRRQ